MMRLHRIGAVISAVVISLGSPIAISQEIEELVVDGTTISGTVELFVNAIAPEGWLEQEAADPNGRPIVPGAQRFVTLDAGLIGDLLNPDHTTPFRIDLLFMKDHTYTIIVEDIKLDADTGVRQVRGRVRGDDSSLLSLAMTDDYIRGTLHAGGWVLEFRRAGGGVSVIQLLDPKRFPKEREPRPAHRQPGFDLEGPQPFGGVLIPLSGDAEFIEPYDGEPYADTAFEPAEFTVLALKSKHEFTDEECDDDANDLDAGAYTNNLISVFRKYATAAVTFRCVELLPTQVEKWTTLEGIRQYLMDPSVTTIRDAEAADLVVMIVKDGLGACGYTMYPDYPKYPIELYGHEYKENAAFAVVDESCALGQASFAHEIGHLLGMKHERFNESGGVNHFCGYGYPVRQMGRPIRQTVMAYDDYCDYMDVSCSRVPYYSIPRQKATGSFAGLKNWWHRVFGKIKGKSCDGQNPGHLRQPANNASQLINSAGLVSQYRD